MLDVDLPESNARVGDRVFMASVFADVFLPHGDEISQQEAMSEAGDESRLISEYITSNFEKAEDKPIFELINEFVLSKVVEFHGICSTVDSDSACEGRNDEKNRNATEVQSIAPISVTRDGYRISVCSKLIEDERAISNMVFNITGAAAVKMKKTNVMEIYNAFYPGQAIDKAAYEALVDVFNSVNSETPLDQWRAVATPICQSSGWQIP